MAIRVAYLDGPRLRRTLVAACDHGERQRSELNRINVFPVPDGDTGTNLALTLRAISDHLRSNADAGVAAVAREAAHAAVLGARGNSGMLLSHFLLGFSERIRGAVRIGPREVAAALEAGSASLTRSLELPVEGTILTVVRETAEEAAAAVGIDDLIALLERLVQRARRSLAETPELLPTLREAGVVDAGAQGFVALLEGAYDFAVGGVAPPRGAVFEETFEAAPAAGADYRERYRFCTEALVRGAELPDSDLARRALRSFGDSLIVIRTEDLLKVHVHTDHPEDFFELLRGFGTLVTHKAEDMRVQHRAVQRSSERHVRWARRPVGIVTDSAADLSEEVVRAHGIHVVPLALVEGERSYRDGVDLTAQEFHRRLDRGGPLPTTSQPTVGAFVEAFREAAEEAESVVAVLLGSALSGTIGAARAAARLEEGAHLHLVDSRAASLLQGLLVLRAAELGELGMPPGEIAAEVERIRGRSGILFTVRTFDRLIASGRLGRGRALLGRFLGLKPILGLTTDGRVVAFARALGAGGARRALLRVLRRQIPEETRRVRFGIVQVGVPDIVEGLTAELRAEFGSGVEVLSAPATPVIATHLGVGAWGIAYLIED